MLAALRGHYVQFVAFMGVAEPYPNWFIEEIGRIIVDESRYCFWTSPPEREPDYYEKELIEDYSIIIRKRDGETHVMDGETFEDLYTVFNYDRFVNGGIAALNDDIIEYVECTGGHTIDAYPEWFYEYFTERLNNPKDEETLLISVNGCIDVKERCVVLRNRFGEIRQMPYGSFLKYYEPRIDGENYNYPRTDDGYWWEDCPF